MSEILFRGKTVCNGDWVYGEFDIPHCSICGHDVMSNMISPYCPNCGAKMEGVK